MSNEQLLITYCHATLLAAHFLSLDVSRTTFIMVSMLTASTAKTAYAMSLTANLPWVMGYPKNRVKPLVKIRRAPAFTFFSGEVPLEIARFAEKSHRKVEKVEKEREKRCRVLV
jgi:hypothetical protein